MRFIFLSPHLDDIALSCGGIVNYLHNQNIKVEIWTIFAGVHIPNQLSPFAQSLHDRWGLSNDAPKKRREEDVIACSILGASYKHFNFLDCIYREDEEGRPIVNEEKDLYQENTLSQNKLIFEIRNLIFKSITKNCILISPLAIGNHIDHQIIKRSIENIQNRILFYEDFPYVVKTSEYHNSTKKNNTFKYDLSEKNIKNWYKSIAEYKSQISTFWISIEKMESEILDFYQQGGGQYLWE